MTSITLHAFLTRIVNKGKTILSLYLTILITRTPLHANSLTLAMRASLYLLQSTHISWSSQILKTKHFSHFNTPTPTKTLSSLSLSSPLGRTIHTSILHHFFFISSSFPSLSSQFLHHPSLYLQH